MIHICRIYTYSISTSRTDDSLQCVFRQSIGLFSGLSYPNSGTWVPGSLTLLPGPAKGEGADIFAHTCVLKGMVQHHSYFTLLHGFRQSRHRPDSGGEEVKRRQHDYITVLIMLSLHIFTTFWSLFHYYSL